MENDPAEWRSAAEANASRLRARVDDLCAQQVDGSAQNYRQFWAEVEEINTLFKQSKPLVKEDRERLWAAFNQVCSRVKEQQRRERAQRADVSQQKRKLVESKLDEAFHQARGAGSCPDLRQANQLLQQALGWMKDGWGNFSVGTQLFTLNDGRMLKDDHDACWKRWREVKNTIAARRQEICELNYGHFKSEAYNAKTLADEYPKEAKEKVREIHRAMSGRMTERWQFDEINKVLDEA